MIIASHGERVEVRSVSEFGTSIVPPPGLGGWPYSGLSWAGRLVDRNDALGLVAVGACIRLLSSQIAAMPFTVYSGIGVQREAAPDSWQQDLLDHPSPDWDAFTFMEDVVSSGESVSNAFIEKIKPVRVRSGQPGVAELRPMDPDYVQVKVVNGRKVIQWHDGAKTTDVTSRVLHVRWWAIKPAVAGTSIIKLHANALGSMVALGEYEGRYFQNDARPSVVISTNEKLDARQRADLREGYDGRHSGRPHGTGILTGGATLTPIGTALKDTQAVDLRESALREAARMFGIPDAFVGAVHQKSTATTPESDFIRLWRLCLFPRSQRLGQAFAHDPDLFMGTGLTPLLDPAAMLRGDSMTLATVIHELVQSGVITQNEGRSMMGLPKSSDPEADKLQHTPVGGAPNFDQTPGGSAADVTPGGGDE